jgi:hypothetical protein
VLLAAAEHEKWHVLELLLRKCARIKIREGILCEMSQHSSMTPLMLDLLRQKAQVTEAIDENGDITTNSTHALALQTTPTLAAGEE